MKFKIRASTFIWVLALLQGTQFILLNSVTAAAPSAVAYAAQTAGAVAAAHPQAHPAARPDSDDQADRPASSPVILLDESGEQILEENLSVDVVAAEAAARPAAEEPSQYAVKGVIDPQSPLFSEEPGVLTPLAQARSAVGNWLAAVEASGPSTPLSDPMFVGTVFIPHNEAFEELYPELRLLKLQGKSSADVFSSTNTTAKSDLALQLNCLTVPGAGIKLDELWPGRMLKTAGLGALKVISNMAANRPARLQHQPSGVHFFILEPDLQTGSAVGHVIDVLPPAAALSRVAAAEQSQTYQYRSVLGALLDPARQLQTFASLVQRAALTSLLDSSGGAFTLFAPNEQAMAAFMASLPAAKQQQLLTNTTLADMVVSSHLVLGTAFGRRTLEALLPAGQLRTPQGNLAVSSPSEYGSTQSQVVQITLLKDGNASTAPAPPRETGQAVPTHESAAQAPPPAAAAAGRSEGSHTRSTHEEGVADLSWSTGDADLLYPKANNQGTPAAIAPQASPPPVHQQQQQPATPAVPDSQAAAAAAAAAASGSPDAPALRRASVTMIADAAMQSGDMVGGKAVLHIVDRVLISPELSRELGLPASPGYASLDAPPPSRVNSNSAQSTQASLAVRVLPLVAAAAALLLVL